MCGRLNVIDDPLAKAVSDLLGISFSPENNTDLRPTQNVSTVICANNAIQQLDLPWGIKLEWAKRIIVNAQAETVATKPTFRQAFQTSRVVVPCSGWYEWRIEEGKKQKYHFTSRDKSPLYMAAIALEGNQKLVTLTTKPNQQCAEYHHRMPLLIQSNQVEQWLISSANDVGTLLRSEWNEQLFIA